MATLGKAVIKAVVELSKRTVELREGDVLTNLTYTDANGQRITDSGAVRVIDCETIANNSIPESCPPAPYLHQFIKVTGIALDTSDIYEADVRRIPIDRIINIEAINGEYDPETIVDNAIETCTDSVVEVSNNNYNIVTDNGKITDRGMIESIFGISNFVSLTVAVEGDTRTFDSQSNLEDVRAYVDSHIPKSNDDPSINMTLTIELK